MASKITYQQCRTKYLQQGKGNKETWAVSEKTYVYFYIILSTITKVLYLVLPPLNFEAVLIFSNFLRS